MLTSETNSEQVNYAAKDKLPFLDGVRGFAALWVLTSHCLVYVNCKGLPILNQGGLAVDIFMLMSGFLMAYHFYKREDYEPWESPSTWSKFYIRRFFRIAPLYYFLLIISFQFNDFFAHARMFIETVYPSFNESPNFLVYKYAGPNLMSILLHVTFLFGLFPQYSTSTPLPDWSIGLEMQFYAVFPAIMVAYRRFSYFWTTILVLGISLLIVKVINHAPIVPPGLSHAFQLPSFLPLKMNLFLTGILLASAHYLRFRDPLLQSCVVILALIISRYNTPNIILGFCILMSLILFYDKSKDPLRIKKIIQVPENLLSNKIATFMADTSYSAYLLHTLIAAPLAALLLGLDFFVAWPSIVRFGVLYSAVLPLTYGISWLLHKYIENPGVLLGKNILKSFVRG